MDLIVDQRKIDIDFYFNLQSYSHRLEYSIRLPTYSIESFNKSENDVWKFERLEKYRKYLDCNDYVAENLKPM